MNVKIANHGPYSVRLEVKSGREVRLAAPECVAMGLVYEKPSFGTVFPDLTRNSPVLC